MLKKHLLLSYLMCCFGTKRPIVSTEFFASIRPGSDSDGPQITAQRAGTLGHFVPRFSGFGCTPTSIFVARQGAKIASVATLALLAVLGKPLN